MFDYPVFMRTLYHKIYGTLLMNEYTDEFTKVTEIFSVPSLYSFKFHQLCNLK